MFLNFMPHTSSENNQLSKYKYHHPDIVKTRCTLQVI